MVKAMAGTRAARKCLLANILSPPPPSHLTFSLVGLGHVKDFLNDMAKPVEKLLEATPDASYEAENIIEREEYALWGLDRCVRVDYFKGTSRKRLIGLMATLSVVASLLNAAHRSVEDAVINLYVGEKAGLNEAGAMENVNASLSQLASSVAPLVSDVLGLRSTLNETLTSNKDNLLLSATVAMERLNRVNTTVGQFEENILYADSMIRTAAPYRWTILLTLFIATLVSVFSGIVGVIAYFTPFAFDDYLISLLNLTFFLSGFICSAGLVLGSVTFSATLFAGDACKMIDLTTADFEPYVGSFAGEVAGLCFSGGNFTKSLNLEEDNGYVQSRRLIDYAVGKVTGFDEQIAFSSLDAETTAVETAAVGLTISAEFGTLTTSLLSMSDLVSSNDYDSTAKYNCPFDFALDFDSTAPLELLEPWEYATSDGGKSGNTGWKEIEFDEIP